MNNLTDKAQQLQDDHIQYGLNHVDLYVEDVAGDWLDTWDEENYIFVDKIGGYFLDNSILYLHPGVQQLVYISLSHQGICLMQSVHCKVTGMRSLHEVIQTLRNQYKDNWNVQADKIVVSTTK